MRGNGHIRSKAFIKPVVFVVVCGGGGGVLFVGCYCKFVFWSWGGWFLLLLLCWGCGEFEWMTLELKTTVGNAGDQLLCW